jgi:hypothetical protein
MTSSDEACDRSVYEVHLVGAKELSKKDAEAIIDIIKCLEKEKEKSKIINTVK